MTNLKRLREWHEKVSDGFQQVFQFSDSDPVDLDNARMCRDIHAETARILALLEAVRDRCDFGPLRELNEGRPGVLCLDFTGPAADLQALAELLEGE